MDRNKNFSVSDFYSRRSVFITGGTGFLGKVIIEKLLYSCPGIDKIYVLTRPKNNISAQERIQQFLDTPLFVRVKEKFPQRLKKVVHVEGELTEPNLGIKCENEQNLLDKVTVVYHCAATIKFNEPLSRALKINLEGTVKVLDLSRRMKNIQAFVYVSTAYTNTDRATVEEVMYPPPAALEDVYKFLKIHGDDEEQTAVLLNGRPNTYAFTKALTEAYVSENHGDVPTVIVRPSIVTATNLEPVHGWVDSWVGSTGLTSAISKGLIRVIISSDKNTIDLIPVDYVSNLSIVAATKCNKNKILVYNCCTSNANPLTMRTLVQFIVNPDPNQSYCDLIRNQITIVFTQYKWIFNTITCIFEIVPAHVMDILMIITKQFTRYVKLQRQLLILRQALEYFTARTWDMRSERTQALAASLSRADRQLFPFDPRDIVWHEYISKYCDGINRSTRSVPDFYAGKSILVTGGTEFLGKTYVYVSTAYTNTDRDTVEEIIYPPPAALEDVYKFLEIHGSDDKQTATLLNGRPNTYIFTKALAASYVHANHYNGPIIIVRPSLVTATKSEPVPGWLENWKGASGIISAVCNGMVRALIGQGNNTIDLIPVDYVSNLIIVTASKCIRKLQQELLILRQALEYFTARTWDLRSERTQALAATLLREDRQLFRFDPRDIV